MKLNRPNARTRRKSDVTCCITISTPVGDLLLAADSAHLIGLYFVGRPHVPAGSSHWTVNRHHPVLRQAQKELDEYFSGQRTSFTLPLRLTGTIFQESVWRHIAGIPYGETVTYTELARRMGALPAVRAVGTATGRNPLSIIIPCHRVVGRNGSLCGFAGGLDRKRQLLELEHSCASAAFQPGSYGTISSEAGGAAKQFA